MRYPVFVAATVTLSVSLASVLTAWLIVAAKASKPVQSAALLGGLHTNTTPPIIFLGNAQEASHLRLPAHTIFMPISTREEAMRVKWLWSKPDGHVLFVQPGVSPSVLAGFLSLLTSSTQRDIVYAPSSSNLFARVTGVKGRRVKQWCAFMRENVHPAWWQSLLYPDLRILLRRASMTPASTSKCQSMVKFMGDFKVWDDQFMFGYFFSPLFPEVVPAM